MWERHEIPSARAINRYVSKWLPSTDLLPSSVIDEKFAGIDVQIDTLNELGQLVIISRDHLARAVKMEERLDIPTDILSRVQESHAKLVEKYLRVMFQLGVEIPGVVSRQEINLGAEKIQIVAIGGIDPDKDI